MNDFKKSIKEYTIIHQQLADLNKKSSEIRKRKKKLEENILAFGIENNLDQRNIKLNQYSLVFLV